MVKVKKSNIVTLQKADNNKNRQFVITVRPKANGFEARMTLKVVGGGKNPRITSNGGSEDEAIYRLLLKVKSKLVEYKKMGLLTANISLKIYDSIISSMNILKMKNEKILQEIPNILQILSTDTIPEEINNNPSANNFSYQKPDVFVGAIPNTELQDTKTFLVDILDTHKKSKDFETVAMEWFNYKLSLTVASEENVKPLSPKTIEGYHSTLMDKLIPYYKNNKNIAIITEEDIKKCIMSFNGFRTQEGVYVVAKMIFAYAREKRYVTSLPYIKKPKKPYTDSEETLIYIESDRQEFWLEVLEQEDTDVALLFETMILEGCRPEEACGLKWKVLKEDTNELVINNAHKDIPIYSQTGKVIGHERRDDRLKTPESYRTLPLNPRLKERLLRHKARQQKMFEELGLEWTEEQYMFLNRYRNPFVPENLSDNIIRISTKYKLEKMTAYGLRHSFATFCCENGMKDIVLMRLMGHTDFNTTQKYYIFISKQMKQREMAKVYENHKKISLEQKVV